MTINTSQSNFKTIKNTNKKGKKNFFILESVWLFIIETLKLVGTDL